jgi:EmrB/QacA subfamily drug resistance transporter
MRGHKYAILAAITATHFAVPFMLSAVAVALPSIGREFDAAATELSLVESSYIASVAVFLLPFGRISDAFGREFIFIAGQVLYTIGTLVLGFSGEVYGFIAIRAVQGFAGAMIVSTALAVLTENFPREERGRALGISLTGVYLGISLGPTLGGLIVTQFGWRWILFIGFILSLAALTVSVMTLRVRRLKPERFRFDWLGTLCIAMTLGPAVIGGAHFSETAGKLALLVSLVFFVLFVLRERTAPDPLVDLEVFRTNTTYSFGCSVQFISYAGTFGVTFLMSLYLQTVHGLSAADAGLVLMIQPLTMAVTAPFSGALADRSAPHRIAASGMGLCTAALAVLAFVSVETSLLTIVLVLFALGLGIGLFTSPNMSIIMGSVPPSMYGTASAMTGEMRTIGMTFGMILIAMILSLFMGSEQITPQTADAYVIAMRTALAILVALTAAGALLSLKSPALADGGDGD